MHRTFFQALHAKLQQAARVTAAIAVAIAATLATTVVSPLQAAGSADADPVPAPVPAPEAAPETTKRQFTFAWPYAADGDLAPRGGTTQGPGLQLATAPASAWQTLQDPALSDYERDRAAILAMAGEFRSTFDFLETIGFSADYQPPRPYQSWGTERVYVIADEPGYIALQHLLVMQIVGDDGTVSEPYVVKHWRQDWRYEDRQLDEFVGHREWQRRALSRRAAKGTWSQAVYQVDDSPRYEAYGRWSHDHGISSWLSSQTWRPLPRREFSVREDYDVLIGTNRHTITPTGWVQEEENLKAKLAADGTVSAVLAKELGVNRYERINNYDFSAGDAYWKRTSEFWATVRNYWETQFEQHPRLKIEERLNDQSLLFTLFRKAEEPGSAALIAETIEPYVDILQR